MAVVFVALATPVVGAAVCGYIIYLTDGFDSELRNFRGQMRKQSERPHRFQKAIFAQSVNVESLSVRTGSQSSRPRQPFSVLMRKEADEAEAKFAAKVRST